MPVYCVECQDTLPDDGTYVSCTGCRGSFHYACTSIKKKTHDSMSQQRRENWRCSFCRTVKALGDTIADRLGIKKLELMITELQGSLDAVNVKIESCIASQKLISEQFENFKLEHDRLSERVTDIEQKLSSAADVGPGGDKKIDFLSRKVVATEQRLYDDKIVIRGVREEDDEDLIDIIKKIAKKINVSVADGNITHVYRMKRSSVGRVVESENVVKSSPICVTFAATGLKSEIMKQKKGASVTNGDVLACENTDGIFINDMMSSHYNRLFWEARNRAKVYSWKYVWFSGGCVKAKKDDRERVITIELESDLQGII